MKWIKTYNKLFESTDLNSSTILTKEIIDYLEDIGLYFNDKGLDVSYQEYGFPDVDEIIFSIDGWSRKTNPPKFSLSDIKEDVEHIISLIEDSGFELKSVRYYDRQWNNIYSNKPNRWSVIQSKDAIFDIQDYDINKKEVIRFELKFSI